MPAFVKVWLSVFKSRLKTLLFNQCLTETDLTCCQCLWSYDCMAIQKFDYYYCTSQICIAHTCYGDVAGWLSVTCLYCIKTAKPILKVFRPSGSPIILVSSDPCADTQFQGEPLQWGR